MLNPNAINETYPPLAGDHQVTIERKKIIK
jgi:hypothetical protein